MSAREVDQAVIETAQAQDRKMDKDDAITLSSSGVRVRIKGVSPSLIQDVISRIKPPKIPIWYNEKKGRDEPNPNAPDYLQACQQFELDQAAAATNAAMMFGLELVDGLPEDDSWLDDLEFIGVEVDRENPRAIELTYKKHIAVGSTGDMMLVQAGMGLNEEAVQRALAKFRNKAK